MLVLLNSLLVYVWFLLWWNEWRKSSLQPYTACKVLLDFRSLTLIYLIIAWYEFHIL